MTHRVIYVGGPYTHADHNIRRERFENVARGDGTAAESTIADADLNAIDTALSKHGEQ